MKIFWRKYAFFVICTEANTKYIKCIPFKATNMGYRSYQNIYGQMKLLVMLCYTQQLLERLYFQPVNLLSGSQVETICLQHFYHEFICHCDLA